MEKLRIRDEFQDLILEIQNASTVDDALRILQAAYGIDFSTYHLALTIADVVDTPYVRDLSRYLGCSIPAAGIRESRSDRARRTYPANAV